MSAFSDYAEDKILNRMLNAQSDTEWPVISDVFIALFTSATTDAGGGTEVTGGSYARKQVTAGFTVVNGVASNTADLAFITATASWGTISHWAAYDAVSAGNLLFHAPMTESRTIESGGEPKFVAGELKVTLD